MRKLHCMLVGILLLIGEGFFARTMEVPGKNSDRTGPFIPHVTIRVKSGKSMSGAGQWHTDLPRKRKVRRARRQFLLQLCFACVHPGGPTGIG